MSFRRAVQRKDIGCRWVNSANYFFTETTFVANKSWTPLNFWDSQGEARNLVSWFRTELIFTEILVNWKDIAELILTILWQVIKVSCCYIGLLFSRWWNGLLILLLQWSLQLKTVSFLQSKWNTRQVIPYTAGGRENDRRIFVNPLQQYLYIDERVVVVKLWTTEHWVKTDRRNEISS